MKGLNELENLKASLLGNKPKQQDQIFRILEIINYLGGWESFTKTPFPVILETNKLLDKISEEQQKSIPKIKGRK